MNVPKILRIIRLHIVAGGVLAYSLGALLALAGGGGFDPARFVLGYAVMLLGDLSAHYSNDYFDVEVDKYITQKKFFAGSHVLVSNPNLLSLSRFISVALLLSSNLLAAGLVLFLDLPLEFFIVILAASLIGWFYSAPPLRLTARGVGEVTVAWVTGFAIPGLGYLTVRGQFDPLFLYLAVPFVIYGLILSLSLEAPDAEIDRKGMKKNFAVRKGERGVFSLILVLAILATSLFLVCSCFVNSAVVDLGVVVLFSVVPLIAGIVGFVGFFQREGVNRFSALNIASLFFFNMLMVAYLLYVVVAHV